MNSALYDCRVMHHRFAPKVHRFRYGIFMVALDLDEIDDVAARIPFFSHNALNVYAFHDSDHLTLPGLEGAGIKANIVAWLTTQGIRVPPGGRIVLVTLPRVFGYVFNPVSFYYCYEACGRPLCAVAEVGNTFGEMKPYLVAGWTAGDVFQRRTPKHFYVSPFFDLNVSFQFRLRVPGERLDIHIDDHDGENRMLVTSLTGRRAPLSAGRLAWLTLKHPLVTLKVIGLIHAHAVALWIKRVPWHRKADNAAQQRGVLKPHASLAGKTS
ncbi:MAG: DUF1365 domain-containing protein [Gemmatimonadetes bacterium]|nr:DUF1365 domain-containing protein [Gemmatimonadota bacterium]